MLSFATEFPIASGARDVFLREVIAWIVGSPHSEFDESDFVSIPDAGAWSSAERDNRKIDVLITRGSTVSHTAVRDSIKRRMDWATEVVLAVRGPAAWVSVRCSRQSRDPTDVKYQAKKPLIVQRLIENIGGGEDGTLWVAARPHWLSNNDLGAAADIISGRSAGRLPTVYISIGFDGLYSVDAESMAEDLAGMAHVMVEPNRRFSRILAQSTDSANAYGGAVGVYWPERGRRRLFLVGPFYPNPADLHAGVVAEVREALKHRRQGEDCTWHAAQSAHAASALEQLKASGSQEVNEFVRYFDQQMGEKDSQILSANEEITRLRKELADSTARTINGSLVLKTGPEQDFHDNEIASVIMDGLKVAHGNTVDDSRRQHILSAILKANPVSSPADAHKAELKRVLRGYTSMDNSTKRALEAIGFEITKEGKHWKLRYWEDDRYTFTLPASGSDGQRGGLNAASDISKRLF